jgi:peptidoglycan/LPS O-acetylase OafA/YrhL
MRVSDKFVPVFLNPEKQAWLSTFMGPDWPAADAFKYSLSPLKKLIMTTDYLVTHQRITPFFIGLILALALHQKASQQRLLNVSKFQKVLHACYLALSSAIVLFPFFMGLTLALKNRYTEDSLSVVPIHAEIIFNVFGRPFYSSAAAYILYRSLLPAQHQHHSKFLSTFLSFQPLQFMGKLSFGVYMTHFIIVVYFIVVIFPPHKAELYVGNGLFHQFLVLLISSYLTSILVAFFVKEYLENLLQPYISRFLTFFEQILDKYI